jgi:uncharacterized membrane protein
MVIHRHAEVDSLAGLLHNPSEMMVLGIITLAAGLAMVLMHNVWSGGALTVVVTLIGWITLIKGLVLLYLLPYFGAECYLKALHDPLIFYLYMAPSLLIGIYLTYGGFRSKLHS